MPLKGTPIWRLMGSPHKAFWPNISRTKYRADLILVEAFITFNFFHFLDFGLSVWNGCIFIFNGVTVNIQNTDFL